MGTSTHRFTRIAVAPAFLLLLFAFLPAQAGTFVIVEESFENLLGAMPAGWSRESSYSSVWSEDSGKFTTPYGTNAVAIWAATGVKTTNITDRLQPGVTYTLTFNAGNSNDAGVIDPLNRYMAQILAGTNVIASASAQTDTKDMSEGGTVTITTDDTHPHLGKVLGVRFEMAGDWHYKTLIDNVKLVAEESAEWTRTLFLGR